MLESGTIITTDLEPLWLQERSRSVGASESAAALGLSPYVSPLTLWQRKLGLAPAQSVNDAMRWGKRLESSILEAYAEDTGRQLLARQLFLRHGQYPYFTATLDAVAADRIVEVKAVSAWADGWGDEGTDQVPDVYLIQVQHQLACTDAERADLVALVGGQSLRVYTIERNEELIAEIEGGIERFWDHVTRRVPPAYGARDSQALAILNPECHGEIDLPAEIERLVAGYQAHGETIKDLEAEREEFKAAVLAAMGTAKTGRLSDGRRVNRVLSHTEECSKLVHYKASTRHYFTVSSPTKGRSAR